MVQIAVLLHATHVWQLDDRGQRAVGGVLTWRTATGSVRDEVVAAVCDAFEEELRRNKDVLNRSVEPIIVAADETRDVPDVSPPVNTGLVFYLETDD